jgi:hypothetical protein
MLFFNLSETPKSVWINCLIGNYKFGHTGDTQNFRNLMNSFIVFEIT